MLVNNYFFHDQLYDDDVEERECIAGLSFDEKR